MLPGRRPRIGEVEPFSVRVEQGRLEISFGIARLPLEADALPRDAVRV